jgi:hypothetical protein
MKTLKHSIAIMILLIGMLATAPVKATTPVYGDSTSTSNGNGNAYGQNNGNGGYGNGNGNGNQNNLPINNGILFLFVAGVAIGIKVVTGKAKKLQAQKA